MSALNGKILLIEDKLDNISHIENMIKEAGYEVFRAAGTPQEALRMTILMLQSTIIIAHDSLGNTILSTARELNKEISIIMLGTSDETLLLPSSEAGKTAYLKAPFTTSVLKAVIDFISR
jgi:DNA-binding response OmpR family regulator